MAAMAPTVDLNSNNSKEYIIPVTILLAIALPVVVFRIWTRITRTKKLYFDDWLIVLAEPLSIMNACLAYAAIGYGWGKPMVTVSPDDYTKAKKLQFALQTTWLFTLCFVRLSVACSLLRFGTERWWRWTLYFIAGLQVLISSSYVVIQFGQCRPISWNWEMIGEVECWDIQAIINYGWAIGGVYVLIDLTLSLMPIKLIMGLHRSKAEKFLIGVLMALGLSATAFTAAKMSTFTSFGNGDPNQATMLPSTLAKLEEIVGIIACSLPALKSSAENLLRRFGILKEHQLSRPSFVQSVESISARPPQEKAQRSSGDVSGSLSPQKMDVRIGSANLKPGSSSSCNQTPPAEKGGIWNPV